MQNHEMKSKIKIFNVKELIKSELINDKYIKTTLYVGICVFSLFAFGFIIKSVNYTIHNLKNLNDTLKR